MELVAAAKLRRAQTRIEAMRPFAERMQELMVGVARASTSFRGLPLLQRRELRKAAILPLTGDRGLAGAFNAQILRAAFAVEQRQRAEGVEPRWLVAGKKGASTLRFRRYEVEQAWTGFSDSPRYADAQAIAHRISELYAEQEVDQVVVIYNHFESALTQRVVTQEVLPIPESLLEAGDEDEHMQALLGDFIYEPEPEQILERLLPVYVETELYRALLESAASEQGARMTAMRNASKNAAELIDNLTLEMNRARQAEITQEILEVVGGAEALTA
jgi:F-type H+-transporting ATPase subunit gamma